MSFFSGLMKKPGTESVLFFDIGAGSVGGAYGYYVEGADPVLCYAKRVPIEQHEGEPHDTAMLRALTELCAALVREGAPALKRLSGSGSAGSILVSVSAPWQKTTLRHEHFDHTKPFTFTRALLESATRQASESAPGWLLVDESVVGTLLNGYETTRPFGKLVTRAQVLILTSHIEEKVARGIAKIIRGEFHTPDLLSIAGSSLRYQAIRSLFPHERDALIVDATGPALSASLVRHAFLVAVDEIPNGEVGSPTWMEEIKTALGTFAVRYPLPRIIFLFAEPKSQGLVAKAFTDPKLDVLWLSEEPPKVIALEPAHVSGIKNAADAPPDAPLMLMALFWKTHGHDE